MHDTRHPKVSPVRPEVEGFAPYVAGRSIDDIREAYGLTDVIKLASNENPLGVSPRVQETLARAASRAFRYPRSGNPELCAALAVRHAVDAARVVMGNGSDELIDLVIRVMAQPGPGGSDQVGEGDEVLAFEPSFSMYAVCAKLCGVRFRQVPLAEDFSMPFDSLLAAAGERTKVVFVTTPDNPSGFAPLASDVRAFAEALAAKAPQAVLVLDEAYMDFCEDPARGSLLPALPENAAVLRTFSKCFGLAGLRLGYGVFPAWLADYLWRVRPPFSVNVMAEAAGLTALDDRVFYEETLRVTRQGRAYLQGALTELGCAVWPSQANFLMFCPPQGHDATGVNEGLLRRGVIVRPLSGGYAQPDKLRVSVGRADENLAFADALREVLRA